MTHTLSPPPGQSAPPSCSTGPGGRTPVDVDRIADLVGQLLAALGEDPHREGLADTPGRVAAWYRDFLSPEAVPAARCFAESQVSDQLVVVSGMSVWSLCEHHLLPMHLQVTAGYRPDATVLGLSKFGRIARAHAGRLQVQERFTRQVADAITHALGHQDVAVAVCGTHLCMSMRGVRMEAARTTTLEHRGRLEEDPALAQRFLTLATSQWGLS
ncbi:GTP cyclohydrolase I [Nocardiopsis sp. CNT312]|uniref:GTP cyclohydrolase I n=1 Tax=Nocardiopsis sp. CNT312 TaxID=1137268 RepID=UPI00048B6AFA|nr:GTP cyclohydrolase I [Nocardiopsis sp. CNT312]